MPSISPQTIKLKSTLRLLVERLRNAQRKDTALSIAARREMATLLSQNRETSARIRVENIIQTDICVEVMEILELYAELLLARAGLLDLRDKEAKTQKATAGSEEAGSTSSPSADSGLEEAAAAMIYAAPRLPRDVRELPLVRNMLMDRWGKEFSSRAGENRDGIVPDKVVNKLKVEPPSQKLVELYLTEIARTYGVDWPKREEVEGVEDLQDEVDAEDDGTTDDADTAGDSGGGGGGQKASTTPAATTKTPRKSRPQEDLGPAFSREELSRATPPREIGPAGTRSPLSVAPPGARTDNPSPRVKMPGNGAGNNKTTGGGVAVPKGGAGAGGGGNSAPPPSTAATAAVTKKSGTSNTNAVGGKIPDVDELAKRFQALKR